ncbi:MAG TPA: hypothetical protein IAC81_04795 [Candidatus Scatomorpha stercorigallinarum]|nr:hypothetical protein [Candidatus Scatomorpha stercorigallinarum]
MGKNKIRLIAAALLLVWLAIMAVIFVRSSVRRLRSALETELARLESGGTALEVIAFPGGEVREFSGDEADAAAAAGRSLEYGGVKRKGAIRTEAGDYRVFIDTAGGPVWLFVRADGRGSVDCSGSFTVRVKGAGELYSVIDGLMKGETDT